MNVFFTEDDRREYLKHLAKQGERFGVSYLAWCLMSNHSFGDTIPNSRLCCSQLSTVSPELPSA